MLMPTKILVPTDFTSYSDKALHELFDIAKEYKTRVYVVHVLYEKNPYDSGAPTIPSYCKAMEKRMIRGAMRHLQRQTDKFPQAKELEVFDEVVNGSHPGGRKEQRDRPDCDSISREIRHCKIPYRQRGP